MTKNKIIAVCAILIVALISFPNIAKDNSEDALLSILDQSEKLRVIDLYKAIDYLEPQKELFESSGSVVAMAEYNLYLGFYYIAIGKLEIGETFLEQATLIVDQFDIPEQKADEIFFRGLLSQKKAEIEKGTKLFNQHFEYAKKHGLVTNQIYSKIHLNQLYSGQGNNLEALTHLKEAYRLLPFVKPQKWKRTVALKALVAGSMGKIYANLGEYEQAIEFHEQAIKGFYDFNSLIDAGVSITRLANLYFDLSNIDKALVEFQRLKELADKINNEKLTIFYFQGIGRIYQQSHDYLKAEEAFNNALEIAVNNEWNNYIHSTKFSLAKVLIDLEELDQARNLLESIVPYFAEFGLTSNLFETHYALQKIHAKKNDFAKAHLHLDKALEFYKVNQNEQTNHALAKVRVEMELELKAVSNRLLAKENEFTKLNLIKQEAEIKDKNSLLILSTVVLTLSLFIIFVLIVFSRKLHRKAVTDSMTGLANRRRLFEFGEREFAKAKKRQTPLSVIMFDLDRFKFVNDTLGHEAGDKVIIVVSEICSALLSKNYLLARLGGDEFIIVLPNSNITTASELAEEIRFAIESYNWSSINKEVDISSSFGVATLSGNQENIDKLIKISDGALYKAKEQGRNRVVIETNQ